MERNIPDVRDIFNQYGSDASHRKQELRSYEYSPRSRRKYESIENEAIRTPPSYHESRSNAINGGSRKNNKHRQSVPDDFSEPLRQNKKSDENNQKTANSRSKDSSYYANRTLTERDIRHLERHLSMKKTIRKQISRNLAQAFVDDPELVMKDPIQPIAKSGNNHKMSSADRTFTLTRAKVSKSEQNVLDLLKDNEPDSGHCSADNPNSSDDDSQEQTRQQRPNAKYTEKPSCNSRSVAESRNKQDQSYKDDGKFSFWKMFSVKNRGKR